MHEVALPGSIPLAAGGPTPLSSSTFYLPQPATGATIDTLLRVCREYSSRFHRSPPLITTSSSAPSARCYLGSTSSPFALSGSYSAFGTGTGPIESFLPLVGVDLSMVQLLSAAAFLMHGLDFVRCDYGCIAWQVCQAIGRKWFGGTSKRRRTVTSG
jgi:hypothetical protein